MNVRKSLAALAAYAALAVNQSFAAEEAKPKDEFGISVNVVYSQRFIPELSDDWRVDCFRATDEQTGAQRLAFSYVQGAVPDFPVRFGWPSDALQVQSVTRVQDLVRQLENSEFSKADFIAQAKFLSAAEKRFFLSNMGSIGGAMYGGSYGDKDDLFEEARSYARNGTTFAGRCGPIHMKLAGLSKEIDGPNMYLVSGIGHTGRHIFGAAQGEQGWDIFDYGTLWRTNEKNFLRALQVADAQFGNFVATHYIHNAQGRISFLDITPDGASFFSLIGKDPLGFGFNSVQQLPFQKTGLDVRVGNYSAALTGKYVTREDYQDKKEAGLFGFVLGSVSGANPAVNQVNVAGVNMGVEFVREYLFARGKFSLSVADVDARNGHDILLPLGLEWVVGYRSVWDSNTSKIFLGVDMNTDVFSISEMLGDVESINDGHISYRHGFVGFKHEVQHGQMTFGVLGSHMIGLELGPLGDLQITQPSTTAGLNVCFAGQNHSAGLLFKTELTGAGIKPGLKLTCDGIFCTLAFEYNILLPADSAILPSTFDFRGKLAIPFSQGWRVGVDGGITVSDREEFDVGATLEKKF